MGSRTREKSVLIRIVVIATVLIVPVGLSTKEIWAGNKPEPEMSPHLQRPPDIPLERLDRPPRPLVRVNVNTASPHQLQRLPGLSETDAEKIIQGRPYKHQDELVTKKILSQEAYEAIANLIIVE